MNPSTPAHLPEKAPIARGWLLWLTWAFVALFALSLVASLLILAIGPEPIEAIFGVSTQVRRITLWWGLKEAASAFFAVACVGLLLRNRAWASTAVVAAWILVAIQSLDAAPQLFESRLSIPIGLVFYIAFAVKLARVLRQSEQTETQTPLEWRGAL